MQLQFLAPPSRLQSSHAGFDMCRGRREQLGRFAFLVATYKIPTTSTYKIFLAHFRFFVPLARFPR